MNQTVIRDLVTSVSPSWYDLGGELDVKYQASISHPQPVCVWLVKVHVLAADMA